MSARAGGIPLRRARLCALLFIISGVPSLLVAADLSEQAQPAQLYLLQFSVVGLILLQAAVIVVLLFDNRRYRLANDESQQHQAAIAHTKRLAIVGELTASIIHEVSQPLGAILSNADAAVMLLESKPPRIEEIRQILMDIHHDDLRANSIIQHLRTVLAKGELRKEWVDLNEIARGTLQLILPDAARRNVHVRSNLDPGLPAVLGDAVHLQQVILNLMMNAMSALETKPANARQIDITTQRYADGSVGVAVGDNGCGILEADIARLFDSFFTTRRNGLGLGLSIARAIVQAHGGTIWATNLARGGASFGFSVPLAPGVPVERETKQQFTLT